MCYYRKLRCVIQSGWREGISLKILNDILWIIAGGLVVVIIWGFVYMITHWNKN